MTVKFKWLLTAVAVALPLLAGAANGEELWLYDNSRIYGLIKGVSPDKTTMTVMLPDGQERKVALEEIVAIRFLGRNPLLVQSGTQEFRFVNGGSIRGEIQKQTGDVVQLQTAMAGRIFLDLARAKGFVSLPLIGTSGRKVEELVEAEAGRMSPSLDVVLDKNAAAYPGVIRKLDPTEIRLDHEELLKVVPLDIRFVAGARLADATRDAMIPWTGDVQVRVVARDDSRVQGVITDIRLGRWQMEPLWDRKSPLSVDLEEISTVQVLGGRVQYLSQLTPVTVKESTVLAPPQPYRMDRSCQGDPISISGKRYPWGIGVHADSALTFALNGKFKEFMSDIGIATRMGDRGSVVFRVLGDGRELFKSPVIKGRAAKVSTSQPDAQSEDKAGEVKVDVTGVKLLTLEVTNAGDLDLGDVANWGSARVLR